MINGAAAALDWPNGAAITTASIAEAAMRLAEPFAIIDEDDRIAFANLAFQATFRVHEGDALPIGAAAAPDLPELKLAGMSNGLRLATGCYRHALDRRERTDALTGLPNRIVLREALDELAANPAASAETCLLLIDLDRFKMVNDTLGHPIGDKLLCRVVERLAKIVADDILVRLGGDEFALLHRGAAGDDITKRAQRIVDLIGRSYLIDDHLVTIGASIGIAALADARDNVDKLLKNADLALYDAKDAGRGQFRFFEQEMDDRAQARRILEQDMRKALALRQFSLHYQPQVDISDRSVLGFEALVRWRHPTRGMISPAQFVPVAEETGLIVQIGEWILRTACHEAATWPSNVSIAVNLSPVQIAQRGLPELVMSALANAGLEPSRLELEITENVLLKDTEATLDTLHRLRALGVRIAMDDFGTGYSSLSYLRAFPFDRVKIDQSFIREMATDREAAAIVQAVLSLGISLGISMTAEGVESEEQVLGLRNQGCTELQGYLISRPVPPEQIADLLRRK